MQHSPPPNNWKLSPRWALPLISQPEVNFTACNLHMFIYRNLIYVISDSPFSHMLKCSHPHVINKHVHRHIHTLEECTCTRYTILFMYSVKYIVPKCIYLCLCRKLLGETTQEECYFTFGLTFCFKKVQRYEQPKDRVTLCWGIAWAGVTYCILQYWYSWEHTVL